ncbi:hypothetical protein, partial [Acinetobacter baumannii]|uniref:hypothetical protein n=1 Tax=Acinetobacter baumannii TaxID=470 RepID=UPI000A9AA878
HQSDGRSALEVHGTASFILSVALLPKQLGTARPSFHFMFVYRRECVPSPLFCSPSCLAVQRQHASISLTRGNHSYLMHS